MKENNMNYSQQRAKNIVTELLAMANININGKEPWDIKVNNPRFYNRLLRSTSLGLGESYMDGWWDCKDIANLISKLLQANVEEKVKKKWKLLLQLIPHKLLNFQTKKRSLIVGKKHYDIGNDLYQHMLDQNMNYSCGYWKNTTSLDEAQHNKLELICRKLCLKPGMKLLDIGCGWGAMAKHAALNYGVEVVGITISEEQRKLAQEHCAGLPISIRFQDYRDINEKFDRIVSIGMIEHVGYKNYQKLMKIAYQALKKGGIFLLHTIGSNKSSINTDKWISKYIFPNSQLPSIAQIGTAIEKLFVMEDWHNFGSDYDKTLMSWYNNFNKHNHTIKSKYNDHFYRMWNYYLLSCAGSFRARHNQLWQVVLSKKGIPGGYYTPR